MKEFILGNSSSIGGGEVVTNVCNRNGAIVGEVFSSNGVNPNYPKSDPSLEDWVKGKTQSQIEEMAVEMPYSIVCPDCNRTIGYQADEYRERHPNSADVSASQRLERHLEEECGYE